MLRLIVIFCFLPIIGFAQDLDKQIKTIKNSISKLDDKKGKLLNDLRELKLDKIIEDMDAIGYPHKRVIKHRAMVLAYSETHEQAKWVMHMILPDIKFGKVKRTNDFRVDPLIKTGTAVQEDYFLTDTLDDGEVEYFGFGYDRGHLAPSDDFRWSYKALSESYFYSNMSPQAEEFNQQKWSELESFLRAYAIQNNTSLYIFTAPVLSKNLPKIDRSINKVSIPEQFVKVAYDKANNRAIAFLMDNKKLDGPLEEYATCIDEVEDVLRYDIFPNIDESVESSFDFDAWNQKINVGDAVALRQTELPKNHFNTTVAKNKIQKKCTVCGTAVAVTTSRNGNVWINLDKKYPNQVFSGFVSKEDVPNFGEDLRSKYESKVICLKGTVRDMEGAPVMSVSSEKHIKFLNL